MKPCPKCGGRSREVGEEPWDAVRRCLKCGLTWEVDERGNAHVHGRYPGEGWMLVPEGCLLTGKGEPE